MGTFYIPYSGQHIANFCNAEKYDRTMMSLQGVVDELKVKLGDGEKMAIMRQ